MRISAKVDYGMRAMVELAAADPDALITAERIAEAQQIPLKFLHNIFRSSGTPSSSRATAGRWAGTGWPGRLTRSRSRT